MAKRKYVKVRGYTYMRKAKTIVRRGPHGERQVVHLKAKRIHVRPHKAKKPTTHRTRITIW